MDIPYQINGGMELVIARGVGVWHVCEQGIFSMYLGRHQSALTVFSASVFRMLRRRLISKMRSMERKMAIDLEMPVAE